MIGASLVLAGCDRTTAEPSAKKTTKAVAKTKPSATSAPPPEFWRRLADTWVVGNPIPDFRLTDHAGRPFQLAELRGDHVLVGLVFTHCSIPEACARTTDRMFDVGKRWKQRQKAGKTRGASLRLLTLTFDPEEDTPEVLKAHSEGVRSVLPDWIWATGPTELMEARLPAMFGVVAGKKDDSGAIAHSVKAVLLGPGLRVLETWTDNAFAPEDVFAMVERREGRTP